MMSDTSSNHRKSKKREKPDNNVDECPSKRTRTTSNTSVNSVTTDEYWNEEEIEQLIETVGKQIPKGDKTYRHVLPLLDWQSIRIGIHPPDSCKKKFEFIMSKVRKERSCWELVNAAKAMNNKGRLLEYPDDMPRKPLPGVFNFFTERIRKLKSKHPDWPFRKIKMQVQEDFKNLSEKKKAKLKAKYEQELAEYQKALAMWREKHPEFYSKARFIQQAPRLTSPMSLYLRIKCNKDLSIDPTLSKAELKVKYNQKWKAMKDKKKYRYLNKAVKAKIQYDKDLEEYMKSHPDYKPPRCRVGFLTSDEWKIKEKFDGKPESPPRNGFCLFVTECTDKSLDQAEMAKRWKDLPEEERDSYNKRAKEIRLEYPNLLKAFLDKLDEDERKVYEEHLRITQTKHSGSDLVEDDKDNCPDKQKNKQACKTPAAQNFPGAPQKPPSSGYQLFCTLLLRETKDIPNKERMAFCAQEWKKADKEKYKKMCKKENKKYKKAVEEYISKLPEEAAAQFLQSKSKQIQKISLEHLLRLDDKQTRNTATSPKARNQSSGEHQVQVPSSPGGESSSSVFVDIDSPTVQQSLPDSNGKRATPTHYSFSSSSSSSSETDNDDDKSSAAAVLTSNVVKDDRLFKVPKKKSGRNRNRRTPSGSSNDQTDSEKRRQKLTHISYESFSE